MSKVLSKYSRTKNSTTEYQSQIDYIDAAMNQQKSVAGDDISTPLTFKEWYGRNVGIIPGEEYIQYNNYLKNWYTNRYTSTDNTTNTKESYINLLKQLKVILVNDAEYGWIQNIDLDNDLELEDSIPYFAKKLKEIAIYLVNKREAIKKAKLKYNMVGSKQSIERLFYEYLLKAFTKRDYVLNVPEQSAIDTFPELSAVNKGFQIQIQEIYDDTSYFDKDPLVPVSAYFDLTQSTSSYYVDTMSFSASALNWIFQTGFMNICADNSLIWAMSSTLNDSDWDRIALSEKYLGEKQYYLKDGYYKLDTKSFIYNIQQGNNWFYWPSGEYFKENISNILYEPIMLSATNLVINNATGSTQHKLADKIFVRTNNEIKGAWLKSITQNAIVQTMSALVNNNDILKFRFPYPGYGISGEGLDWTGKQLNNIDNTFNYLDKEQQNEILDMYWSSTETLSTFDPISIHDTQLIDNGSYASQNYNNADKLIVRLTNNTDNIHDTAPSNIYNDGFDYAWLYKILKTDIITKVGQNYISWPLERYETTPIMQIATSQCIPLALSSINVEDTMMGARAGYGLYDSDIIYKLNSPNGYPTQCAILSGKNLSSLAHGATGKIQPSFTLLCKPGNYETFIWVDDSININNSTIIHKEHQKDCDFLNIEHTSIYKTKGKSLDQLGATNTGIGNYKECTCKSIWYSPLGHPGLVYDDYDKMADIIFVDKDWNTVTTTGWPSVLDITTWKGRDGLPYNQSVDFAWYQLSGANKEMDIGWGKGQWVKGNGSVGFTLEKGVQYKYLRSNLRRDPADLVMNAVPNLVIKQKHINTPAAKWMKCLLQTDGTWTTTDTNTDMLLNPGDYILYDHVDSYWYCLSTDGTLGTASTKAVTATYIGEYNGWLNLNFVSTGYDINLSWPNKFYPYNPPTMLASEATYVSWEIKYNGNNLYYLDHIDSAEYVTFNTGISTGIYTVSVTGYGNYRNEIYSLITPITCIAPSIVSYTSGTPGIETIYNDRLNFVINVPLSGWNYTTHSYDGISQGGRPYWGKGIDDSSQTTKYKGIDHWGGGIRTPDDDYTFITQPEPATLSLSSNCYTEYYNNAPNTIKWEQPISFNVITEQKEWKKLQFNTNVISPLSSYLFNINNELVVSSSDETSDIQLYQPDGDTMWVNYWAQNAFTWTQELTDITLGYPPTGGTWVPIVTGEMISPIVPYANLTNRHYPTIASIASMENLYTTEESGGYFVPKTLGTSVYIGKNYTNNIDITKLSNNPNDRGISAVFQDVSIYTSDNGLTNTLQTDPLTTVKIDASWMKASLTEGYKAGSIVNAKTYQEFIPYQTRYETTNINNNGLRTQNDEYDPWYAEYDNTWKDPIRFPSNFRNEYLIDNWYNSNTYPDKVVWEWKTDIFGNQYFLLKDRNIQGIYNKSIAEGSLWVKNVDSIVAPASSLLSSLYMDIQSMSPVMSSELINIKHFDIWFDTIMLQTSSNIIINKIIFNYDNVLIDSLASNIRQIELSGNYLAGTWLYEENKKVTICTLISAQYAQGVYYPELYELNLNNNKLTKYFSGYDNTYVNQMSSLQLSSIEQPVLTYNNITRCINVSFIGHTPLYSNMVLNTMNIKNYEDNIDIMAITPLI